MNKAPLEVEIQTFDRLDHIAIYTLIAGTYTPVAWNLMNGWSRWLVLVVAWSFAAAGAAWVSTHGILSPSVSTGYDIRPTLWSAKEGVDVYCSKKDWVALGFVVRVIGTTDNFWSGSAAGRLGFKPKKSTPLADLDATRLRQHFWSPEPAWPVHTGGHHGVHAPTFVQTYLMPLMMGK